MNRLYIYADDSMMGRQVGTIGDLGTFSFFSKKQLCVGEGGMVTTAGEELADRVRLFRSHAMTSSTWDRPRGHDPAYDVVDIGFNYRLDEPRAALGLSRLSRLSESIAARAANGRAGFCMPARTAAMFAAVGDVTSSYLVTAKVALAP